jgi:hypothetical protein
MLHAMRAKTRPAELRLCVLLVLGAGACTPFLSAREAELATVLARADAALLRERPLLAEGKYQRMAASPSAFHQGSLALFRQDWELGRSSRSDFLADLPPVSGVGDAYLEAFGLLASGPVERLDDSAILTLEAVELESAGPVPYLFDVRRLVAGLRLVDLAARRLPDGGSRLDGGSPPDELGLAAARAYAEELVARADAGDSGPPLTEGDVEGAALRELFTRASEALRSRPELARLTELDEAGAPRLRRGAVAEPGRVLSSLPPWARRELPTLLRLRLGDLPWATPLDAVRDFGQGITSFPRLRALVLLPGPTAAQGDEVLLEVRELDETPLAGWYRPPAAQAEAGPRVQAASARVWSAPGAGARSFTGTWLGLPVQVRTVGDAVPRLSVERLLAPGNAALRTPDSLRGLARTLGRLLARIHARSEASTVRAIAARLTADVERFAQEQSAFATAHAAQTVDDAQWLALLLGPSRLGPRLGATPCNPRPLEDGGATAACDGRTSTLDPEAAALLQLPPPTP